MIPPTLELLKKFFSFEWEDEPSKPLTDKEYYDIFGESRDLGSKEIEVYDSTEIHRKDYGDFSYFSKCLDALILAVEHTSKELPQIKQTIPKGILPLKSEYDILGYIKRINKKILNVRGSFVDKIWDPGLSEGNSYYDDFDGILKKFFLVEYNLCSDRNPYMYSCGNSVLRLNLSIPHERYEEGIFVRIHAVLPQINAPYFGLATSCTESFIEEESMLRKNLYSLNSISPL